MQHYGAPTRLLDVTSSIFVALYFAFEKNSCNTKSVWAFRKEQLLHGQGELDTVKKAKEQYKKTLETDPQYAPDTYENGIMWFLENEYQQEKECIELVEEILNSSHKEAKGIVPVVPGYYNRRIAAQSGSFLFSTTLLDSFESNLKHTLNFNAEEFDNPSQYAIKDYFDGKFDFQSANLIKFNFNPVNCFSAENIFHNANISAKKLFPDLTGIAKSIRYKNET